MKFNGKEYIIRMPRKCGKTRLMKELEKMMGRKDMSEEKFRKLYLNPWIEERKDKMEILFQGQLNKEAACDSCGKIIKIGHEAYLYEDRKILCGECSDKMDETKVCSGCGVECYESIAEDYWIEETHYKLSEGDDMMGLCGRAIPKSDYLRKKVEKNS